MAVFKDYYPELLELKNKGYNSIKIQKWLKKEKGKEFASRYIRRKFQEYGNPFNGNTIVEDTFKDFNIPEDQPWSTAWIKSSEVSVKINNKETVVSFEEMRDSFVTKLKKHSPTFKKLKRKDNKDGHLLIIDIADLHIGKLAESTESGQQYNTDIAVKRGLEGVQGVLNKSKGFNIDKILFVIGNDVLHTDNTKSTTTSGTPQDTDRMWHSNYIIARDMYIEIISSLMQIADVHIVHNPSNHDYMSGFMLADSIFCWFRKSKNITWDVSISHRKYFMYGCSLIGTSHGDGGKMDTLPLTMAVESEDWSKATYRYIYLHHIHHNKKYKFLTSSDFPGITVEYLRSPSGTDSWHHRNQYQHAPKAVEGFIHSKEYGQVAKITHLFK
tara:strand:- start:919 stop:2070 length:1152 start_codon:yes stop_codon:yes gene_type:complete